MSPPGKSRPVAAPQAVKGLFAKAIEIKNNMGHTRIEVSEKYMGYAPAGDEADRFGAPCSRLSEPLP